MQIKKEELNLSIIRAAEREFFLRGFKDASMRKIAEKAHTTIGNLYNYYSNKEALYAAVIGDTVAAVDELIKNHEETHLQIDKIMENVEDLIAEHEELFPLDLMVSPPFLIFLKGCEGTRYESIREGILYKFQTHIGEHLGMERDNIVCETMTKIYIEGAISIGEKNISNEEKKRHIKNYIMTSSFGVLKDRYT